MKRFLAFPLLLCCILHGAELKFYLDGDARNAPDVKKFSSSIRQAPGSFGKALLIERRTVNFFIPDEVVLTGGAELKGKDNRLTMPAGSVAALPLTAIRPKSVNTLSFRFKGEGKITVTFNRREIASFEAGPEYRKAEVAVIPEDDAGTLRIRAEKAAELDNVMFDKGIGYANTYHAPGQMRNVDVIEANASVYSPDAGAISCRLKAPWLRRDAKYANAIALCAVQSASGKGTRSLYISVWENKLHLEVPGVGRKSLSCTCMLRELPESGDGWYHFVFNWERKDRNMELAVIVNGEKVFSKSGISDTKPAYDVFSIGYVNGAYLNGLLDDFGLFSAPLSLEEAKRIHRSKRPLTELFPR